MSINEVRILRPKLHLSLVFWKNSEIKPISPIKNLIIRKNHIISIAIHIIFISQVFLLLIC
ncbi:hypothetical protein HanIR_Chr05g0222001 [Helianthus annuus]|nr:hypothetical protein HanIR_Chr05g0222001 [Helianthus annuus]